MKGTIHTFLIMTILFLANCSRQPGKDKPKHPVGSSPTAQVQSTYLSVASGTFVRLSWSGIENPASDDWIGIFPEAGDDSSRVTFQTTGGGASGSMEIPLPPQIRAGPHELRLYSHGTWELLTVSSTFQIQPSHSSVRVRNLPFRAGGKLEIEWTGVEPSSRTDWIGLFQQGGGDDTRITFAFTTGLPMGVLTLPVPANTPPGKYEVRFHSNGRWQKLATSEPFNILKAAGLNEHMQSVISVIRLHE